MVFTGHHSEESKAKMREVRLGSKNHFFGKHHTEETKAIIRVKNKEANSGDRNPFFGKHHSEETKAKLRLLASMGELGNFHRDMVNISQRRQRLR